MFHITYCFAVSSDEAQKLSSCILVLYFVDDTFKELRLIGLANFLLFILVNVAFFSY